MLEHAPKSSDPAPCDFFVFPKVKEASNGIRFHTAEAVNEKSTKNRIMLSENDLKYWFEQCKVRMKRGRDIGGEYIEVVKENI